MKTVTVQSILLNAASRAGLDGSAAAYGEPSVTFESASAEAVTGLQS